MWSMPEISIVVAPGNRAAIAVTSSLGVCTEVGLERKRVGTAGGTAPAGMTGSTRSGAGQSMQGPGRDCV